MSVELLEGHDSRAFTYDATGATGVWKLKVRVLGEADPETALIVAVFAYVPFFWSGLARQQLRATPTASTIYDVEVDYKLEIANTAAQDPTASPGPSDGPGGGSPSGTPSGPSSDSDKVGSDMSFEIGAPPPKLFYSLATLQSGGFGPPAPPGALVVAPDFQRAVNVGADGKVDGYEFSEPAMVHNASKTFDFITWGYVNLLRSMIWKTNGADWWRYKRREVALMGASIKTGSDGRATIDYRLGAQSQATVAAGKIRDDGVNKLPQAAFTMRGWDFLWVKFVTEFDAATKRSVERPMFYYVEQVLEETNFTALGIG